VTGDCQRGLKDGDDHRREKQRIHSAGADELGRRREVDQGIPFFDVQDVRILLSSTTVPWIRLQPGMDIADGPLGQVSKSLTEYVWPIRADRWWQ